MKICILNHALASGGTDTFVLNAAKELVKRGHQVDVVMAVDEGALQFREQEAIDAGVNVLRTCDLDGIKKKALHAKRLYGILKDGDYDVFHANMDLFNGINMPVSWFAGMKARVCHSHNSSSQYEANTGKHFVVRVYRTLMRASIRMFSNKRCGCSAEAMEYLFGKNWSKSCNSKVVHNGVDVGRFSCVDKRAGGGVRILSLGRLAQQKNPLFALDVISELNKIRDDVEYSWCGDGEMRRDVDQRIAALSLSNVSLLGVRKDVPDIVTNNDILLMPSLFEGLSIAIIEAQAGGLTCFVSSAISEETDCGGCVFLPLEVGARGWAEVISAAIDKKALPKATDERLSKFSISNMVDELEELYAALSS